MTRYAIGLLLFTLGALGALGPAAASAQAIDPVYLVAPTGEAGNGVRFQAGDGCLVVTADHVVESTSRPSVIPLGGVPATGVVVKQNKALDFALISQSGLAGCAQQPTDEAIRRALLGVQREAWVVNSNGDARPLKVDLISYTDAVLRLQIVPNSYDPTAPKSFASGMSGGVVVFDGVPVAILQSSLTDKPIAEARRLDFIRRQFPDVFLVKAAGPAKPEKPKAAPFDIAQLPAEYKAIVQKARETKQKVERLEKDALHVRREAEDAALIAQQYPRNDSSHSYAQFDASNGNYYAGQIYRVGVGYGSQGFGVSEVTKGDEVGNKFYCNFVRDEGCTGFGVLYYAENKWNVNGLSQWIGGVNNTGQAGYGHLTWNAEIGGEAWFNSSLPPSPGVWITKDGLRYEGEIGNNREGLGVLWNKDGSVNTIGVWSGGAVVKNEISRIQ